MRIQFDGRVALVTGGASGIGLEVARGLLEAGAAVGLLDLPGAALEQGTRELKEAGRAVTLLAGDVTDLASARRGSRPSSPPRGASTSWSPPPGAPSPAHSWKAIPPPGGRWSKSISWVP